MNTKLETEIERLIKYNTLECDIEDFADVVDWERISTHPILSEDFIR
jgi:hypothetical protein